MMSLSKSRGNISIVVAVLVLVVAAAIALMIFSFSGNDNHSLVADNKVVALINGEEILGSEINSLYSQARLNFEAQGENLLENYKREGFSDREAKNEITLILTDELINNRLIMQYARSQNISVSEEDINVYFEQILSQTGGEDNLMRFLSEESVSLEEFMLNLEEELMYSSFINEYFNADNEEISEEEILIAYEQVVSFYNQNEIDEEIPSLEDVRQELVFNLKQEKLNQSFHTFVSDLRSEADIEIFI